MKKKPAKGSQPTKKKFKSGQNALNPQRLDYREPTKETKFSIEDLYKIARSIIPKDRYIEILENESKMKDQYISIEKQKLKEKAKIAGKRSGEVRKETYFRWSKIEEVGREIHSKFKSYSRYRIAKKIHERMESNELESEIPSIRAIWEHLTFIPSKRTYK